MAEIPSQITETVKRNQTSLNTSLSSKTNKDSKEAKVLYGLHGHHIVMKVINYVDYKLKLSAIW